APAAEDETTPITPGEILVIATRLAGSVDAPQPPVMTLDEGDIASYGASSLADLIAAVGPQTGSGRGRGEGRPVILFNGQRIANFREMRNIPPEAIRRMEVLPEEVALRFGYQANQRVINFILKDNFASRSVDLEYKAPTRGGWAENEIEATLLEFGKSSRISLNAKGVDTAPLRGSERALIQEPGTLPTVAGDPDPARARTLIADSRELSLTGSWTGALGENGTAGSLSLNGSITRADSRSLSGLNRVTLTGPGGASERRTFGDPLARDRRSLTLAGGGAYNTAIDRWQFTATVDASHADVETRIDRRANVADLAAAAAAGLLAVDAPLPANAYAGADRTQSRSLSVNSLATLSGTLATIPAGDISTTLKAGFEHSAIRSLDSRLAGRTSLDRDNVYGGANLSVPIASRRNGVLAGLGELSLNFSAGVADLSDIGGLADWSAGLTWNPTERLGLQASWFVNEEPPSLLQLGAPGNQTFNVPVYDFARGETVLVTIIDGGNPALAREKQRDLKLALNWKWPLIDNSNLVVEYFRNRSDNVTASFPVLTGPIEAAFPGRVVRDADGRLVSIDRRAITLAQTSGSRLRWGMNLSGTLGKPDPAAAARGRGPGGGPGMRMPGPMGGGGDGRGRWNLSAYHTVRFADRVLVARGGPVLDLLGGDALSGGGAVRHALQVEGGGFYRGFGLRINANWTGPTTLKATGAPGTSDLRFGEVTRVDLRAFVNFDQQQRVISAVPFLKGARLAFEVDNLFESRQKVTDAAGLVPLGYQRDYLDARGRVVGIDFRKVF
ncbi:MAG TPA: TonB-dependent receptor, partial [Novosphingobium sp.]|nr:TonB-dependent receptor [Novosphingobium sp.]